MRRINPKNKEAVTSIQTNFKRKSLDERLVNILGEKLISYTTSPEGLTLTTKKDLTPEEKSSIQAMWDEL